MSKHYSNNEDITMTRCLNVQSEMTSKDERVLREAGAGRVVGGLMMCGADLTELDFEENYIERFSPDMKVTLLHLIHHELKPRMDNRSEYVEWVYFPC
jgi:hypothetical protein